MVAPVRNFLVKMTLRLLYPVSVVMGMVPTLLRQFRHLLQIKQILQMLFFCYNLLNSNSISTNNHVNNSEKRLVTWTPLTQLNKLQKFRRKIRSSYWPMVSFILNGSEIRTWMGNNFKQTLKTIKVPKVNLKRFSHTVRESKPSVVLQQKTVKGFSQIPPEDS